MRSKIIAFLFGILMTVLLVTEINCGLLTNGLKTAAIEKSKEVAGAAAESKAVALGTDLKDKYGIDLAKDSPQQQVLKIIKVEAKSGNGELAALLADSSKVTTIGEALAVVMAHKDLIEKKVASGELKEEATTAAKNTLNGVGALALLNGLVAIIGFLKNKSSQDALHYVAEKIEVAKGKGEAVTDLRDRLKTPLPGEEAAAATLAKLVKEKFPT